jgi:hypothetical protein
MKPLRYAAVACCVTISILLYLAGGCGRPRPTVDINTEYTCVFLDNGQIFVGRLEKAEPSYILLKDVFYIKTWVVQDKDDQSKEIRNTISMRSSEANAPAFTYINTQHILMIEPVSGNSRVSELIKKAKAEKNGVAP